jgi:hypothetical protein
VVQQRYCRTDDIIVRTMRRVVRSLTKIAHIPALALRAAGPFFLVRTCSDRYGRRGSQVLPREPELQARDEAQQHDHND